MAELLEAVMLVSFGLSWPISVMKNIRARSAKSMSLGFTLLIIAGYVSGITAKIISGKTNYVLAVYIINLLIVSANVAIYIRNKKLDSLKEAGAKAVKMAVMKVWQRARFLQTRLLPTMLAPTRLPPLSFPA